MKAGQLDEAERLYELARKDDPFHTKWIAWLARIHLRQKKTTQVPERPGDDRRQRRRRPRRPQGPGRALPGRGQRRRGREMGQRMPVHRRLRPGRSTSSWPTPRPPARSSPQPSRNTRPPSSSRPRSPTTSRSSWPRPSSAWASATPAKATLDGVLKADPEHPEAKALLMRSSPRRKGDRQGHRRADGIRN